jgi:hypothetical protein
MNSKKKEKILKKYFPITYKGVDQEKIQWLSYRDLRYKIMYAKETGNYDICVQDACITPLTRWLLTVKFYQVEVTLDFLHNVQLKIFWI